MGNTVLLKDLMNTRFIINSLSGRFLSVLKRAHNEGLELDLRECRFGPECASIMRSWYDKVDFKNTEDENADYILKANMEAARYEYEQYELLDIKKGITLGEVMELIKTLPTGAKYNVKINLTDIVCKAAIAMIIMARPDITYDIRGCASDIFDFVRDSWIASAEHHESYYELIAPHIVRRDCNNEFYGSDDSGWIRESSFIRSRRVLPVEFGNSQIIKLGSGTLEEWKGVAERCLEVFESRVKKQRIKGKTVKNFLKVREVSV